MSEEESGRRKGQVLVLREREDGRAGGRGRVGLGWERSIRVFVS